MKFVLFNLKYSNNLGDGLIAACLENAILEAEPAAVVTSIDLAGRQRRNEHRGNARVALLRIMRGLPGPIRRTAVRTRLQPMLARLGRAWRNELSGATLAIVGGGNLFQDDSLNLPLKVGAAFAACRQAGVPVAVYSVGVSSGWSEEARQLFASLVDNHVVHVSVRDIESLQAWRKELGTESMRPDICRDPGLLAADLVPRISTAYRARPIIGVGVTHPVLLAHHAVHRGAVAGLRSMFFVKLALACVDRQCDVVFFSNGASEDQAYLRSILTEPALFKVAATGRVRAADRPRDPESLLCLLQSFDAVVAHRLHASIASFALGRPHVGLAWDKKVESFYRSVGRERFIVSGAEANPTGTADLIVEAYRHGLDEQQKASMIAEAKHAAQRLLVHQQLNSRLIA